MTMKETERISAIDYLKRFVFVGTTRFQVCSLQMKKGRTEKAFYRFFTIDGDRYIVDITRYVHYITEYPMRDCGTYWAIYTHCTNDQDIVMLLGEHLELDLVLERL